LPFGGRSSVRVTRSVYGAAAMKSLPYFCRGEVVRGFGRGSKELGIPTANFPDSVVENLPADIGTGIYYGWASLGNGDVHKMVMSIGWNPYYKNTKKSMETHVIHTFKEDFYGELLSVVMVGYIRPERSFDSLDALVTAINDDIEEANTKLDHPEHLKLKEDNFFTSAPSFSSVTPPTTSSGSQTIMNGH
uniref:Riboflavin kinase n=2 Tax=Tetraodon nigroviridis TaxID=99883 RepID=H3DEF5_TETNG